MELTTSPLGVVDTTSKAWALGLYSELPGRNYLCLHGADLHNLAVGKPTGGAWSSRRGSLEIAGEGQISI